MSEHLENINPTPGGKTGSIGRHWLDGRRRVTRVEIPAPFVFERAVLDRAELDSPEKFPWPAAEQIVVYLRNDSAEAVIASIGVDAEKVPDEKQE